MSPARRRCQALAIATLTAKITTRIIAKIIAKIERKKPATKILSAIQQNWKTIAPQDFLHNAKPTHISHAPRNTTLTISADQDGKG